MDWASKKWRPRHVAAWCSKRVHFCALSIALRLSAHWSGNCLLHTSRAADSAGSRPPKLPSPWRARLECRRLICGQQAVGAKCTHGEREHTSTVLYWLHFTPRLMRPPGAPARVRSRRVNACPAQTPVDTPGPSAAIQHGHGVSRVPRRFPRPHAGCRGQRRLAAGARPPNAGAHDTGTAAACLIVAHTD
jgi:hypothetical protein